MMAFEFPPLSVLRGAAVPALEVLYRAPALAWPLALAGPLALLAAAMCRGNGSGPEVATPEPARPATGGGAQGCGGRDGTTEGSQEEGGNGGGSGGGRGSGGSGG